MKTKILIALAAAACTAVSCYAAGAEPQPTLNQALAAPPNDLAQSYLWVKFMTDLVLPAAKKGVTIQLPGEAITKSNVEEYQERYQGRLSVYREAIKQRGYKTISGAYRGRATESCARIQSGWVVVIHGGGVSGIEIAQDGFEAQVIINAEHQGKKMSLRNQAVIVESAIALQDGMNTDYYFRGAIKPREIEVKPNISVLRSWPQWASPPSRKDLENCMITLEPLSEDSQK